MSAKYLLPLLFIAAGASAQATAPQWGQCGGQGWAGATACPSGWVCTVSNQYYSQCLQGAASASLPPSNPPGSSSKPPASSSPPIGGGPSPSSSAASTLPTLVAGNSFIRAVEDPNFHKYLRSEVKGTPGDAILGDPTDASQFIIANGQLQQVIPGGFLYADVEPRANSTVMKLKVSWITTPSTAGSFVWSGDTVTWTSPTISRPQSNAWLVCPDAAGNKDLYVNLGPYSYQTPAGCADETIHAYTGPYPTS